MKNFIFYHKNIANARLNYAIISFDELETAKSPKHSLVTQYVIKKAKVLTASVLIIFEYICAVQYVQHLQHQDYKSKILRVHLLPPPSFVPKQNNISHLDICLGKCLKE